MMERILEREDDERKRENIMGGIKNRSYDMTGTGRGENQRKIKGEVNTMAMGRLVRERERERERERKSERENIIADVPLSL